MASLNLVNIDLLFQSHIITDLIQSFLDELPRLCESSYTPTATDMFYLIETTCSGVRDCVISQQSGTYRVVDFTSLGLGSSKTWLHQCENMSVVMFAVDLCCYDVCDMILDAREAIPQNILRQTLDFFRSVVTSRWLVRQHILLILMNKDIFGEKLNHVPLSDAWPSYNGGPDVESATAYIIDLFAKVADHASRPQCFEMFTHFLNLEDSKDPALIQAMLSIARDSVITADQHDCGLL